MKSYQTMPISPAANKIVRKFGFRVTLMSAFVILSAGLSYYKSHEKKIRRNSEDVLQSVYYKTGYIMCQHLS